MPYSSTSDVTQIQLCAEDSSVQTHASKAGGAVCRTCGLDQHEGDELGACSAIPRTEATLQSGQTGAPLQPANVTVTLQQGQPTLHVGVQQAFLQPANTTAGTQPGRERKDILRIVLLRGREEFWMSDKALVPSR